MIILNFEELDKKSKKFFNDNVNFDEMTNQELAVWYNDNVIYPDKVRLNLYYLKHYSFIKDIEMIFATVLGRHIEYNNEII